MSEQKKTQKHMPFSPVRVKRTRTDSPRLTERQRAAKKRQNEENQRHRQAKGAPSQHRLVKLEPGRVKITSLIADELTRAFTVILKLDGPADVLMKAFFKSNPSLGSRDRTILAEAIFYGLRHLGGIAWRMKPMKPARAPRVAALLTLALQHGEGAVPKEVSKGDADVLAKLLRTDMSAAPAHVQDEMPQWLHDRLVKQFGPEECRAVCRASSGSAPLDLRVNTMKAKREDVIAELAQYGIEGQPMTMAPDGVRLTTKPALIRTPMYQEGRIDVQDEGSQLVARLVGAKRGDMVCDFCAGAGGKTLALGAMMKSTGRLYAFDVNEKRLMGLTPRMRRAGLSNVHPMAIRDERDNRVKRLRGKFDRVLVDAPCTGTGTLRRNPDLKWRLSPEELARINGLQHSILEEASKLVKTGGRLVYATCSMLQEENQAVVDDFLAQHPDFEQLDASEVLAKQGISVPGWVHERFGKGFVMLPHLSETDGFFGAVLIKKAPTTMDPAAQKVTNPDSTASVGESTNGVDEEPQSQATPAATESKTSEE